MMGEQGINIKESYREGSFEVEIYGEPVKMRWGVQRQTVSIEVTAPNLENYQAVCGSIELKPGSFGYKKTGSRPTNEKLRKTKYDTIENQDKLNSLISNISNDAFAQLFFAGYSDNINDASGGLKDSFKNRLEREVTKATGIVPELPATKVAGVGTPLIWRVV